MIKKTNCSFFILGDRGVGKTTLIKLITESKSRYFEETTRGITISDWPIRYENQEINIEIIESSSLPEKIIISMLRREKENSVINIVLSISQNNDLKYTNISWLDKIKTHAFPEAIIIVTLNLVNSDFPQKLNLSLLKRKYPFVRYWVNMPMYKDNEYGALNEYQFLIRQIIINRFSNRLDSVRQLIKINQIEKTKILDIGKCDLTSLLEIKELFDCAHLESLIVSNEWGEFINGEWERQVSSNNGGPNVLYDLPKYLQRLKKLKVLICGGNWKSKRKKDSNVTKWHITDISNLSSLSNLTILNASNNAISSVGQINRLTKLTRLYLNNNNISKLPLISNLTTLKEIYLSNNKLSTVSFLENLNAIKTIDLHSNKIEDLSPIKDLISKLNIKDSKWETNTISIFNNPLVIPTPSVVSKGKRGVLAYFRKLEAEQKIDLKPFKNKDIKLILVGNSNAGKSTLIYWLKNSKINRKVATTHWMTVEKWLAKHGSAEYNVRIFDFGGQEYYHDTHHLFFTNRTAYVVLWDDKSNRFDEIKVEQYQINGGKKIMNIQTFPLEYWLDSINYHTKRRIKTLSEKKIEKLLDERDATIKESLESGKEWGKHDTNSVEKVKDVLIEDENILVVQNKVDTQQDKKFINEMLLKKNHTKIYDFSSISIFNNRRLFAFKDMLFDIFNSMDIINQEYLGTWGYIKQKIENTEFLRPFPLLEFKEFCNKLIMELPELWGKSRNQIKNILFTDQDSEVFAQFLCDIGVILYYPENKFLKEKVFLNQQQVLDNVYKILLGLDLEQGEFDQMRLVKALGKKSVDEEVLNMKELMLHFKIIFEHPSKVNTYIAPLYLPKEPLQSINIFSSLFYKPVYRYQYKTFIYKNVILDFFQHYGKKVLKEANNSDSYYYWREGIVVKDDLTGEIVMVKFFPGNNEGQNAFIDVYTIKAATDETFLKKIIEDLDHINEDWGVVKSVTANGQDFVPLETIRKNEEDDNWVFLHEKKYYKLADFKKYLINPIKMKKILISYSKQDLGFVNKFIEHLSALQLDGKVAHWYCSELEAGSGWDKEIQKHFDEADIVCFMVSPNFMKTSYIHEHEIAKAFEKKEKYPDFKIVPIILDFCRWTTVKNNLGQYTALPYTAKPVADFANENMAWYIIQECLRLMIDENLNPIGDNFYDKQKLPSDVLKIYKRIVEDKVDKS
ncbi:MAG TPA: COR domain-containing protein [Chitinophagaceae bacterium]|nr:COR domain-containing protein [Chitinophagaceae bacterium]